MKGRHLDSMHGEIMGFKTRPWKVFSSKEIILSISLNGENTLEVSLSQINTEYDRLVQRDSPNCYM